jgi:hypothetical protein
MESVPGMPGWSVLLDDAEDAEEAASRTPDESSMLHSRKLHCLMSMGCVCFWKFPKHTYCWGSYLSSVELGPGTDSRIARRQLASRTSLD